MIDEDAPTIGITQAARMIGVSRARMYQRITQQAGGWTPGRPFPAETGAPISAGARNGKQIRVALADVLAWRAEREAAGLPVGPIPDTLAEHIVPDPPTIPPIIGLPTISPF